MEQRRRKRGVKASRQKLEAAMLACGLETQLALAKKIAAIEKLDKPPKDLVNKVFREQAVSVHNLTRVAKALEVPTHSIYFASTDHSIRDTIVQQSSTDRNNSVPNKSIENGTISSTKFFWPIAVLIVFLSVVFGIFLLPFEQEVVSPTPRIQSYLNRVAVVIQSDERSKMYSGHLVQSYADDNVINVVVASSPKAYTLSPHQVLDEWQAHIVLKYDVYQGDIYRLLRLTASTSEEDNLPLLEIVARETELFEDVSMLTEMTKKALVGFIRGEQSKEVISIDIQGSLAFLSGKEQLYKSHLLEDYKLAEDFFLDTLKYDNASFAALSELCKIYVRKSWIVDEVVSLEKAAEYCSMAEDISADHPLIQVAKAELRAQVGEIQIAESLAMSTLSTGIQNADTYALLSDTYLKLLAQGNEESANKIGEYAEYALKLEPNHWKAFNTLGNYYYQIGNIALAKENFFNAAKLVKQEVILSNLGTMQLCTDELQAAQQTYQELIKAVDGNYLGYENLGTVYFFLHRFRDALMQKLLATERLPDVAIHQVWASLGEVYLQLGLNKEAAAYYTKALTILDRDQLLDVAGPELLLFKVYYQTKLEKLTNKNPKNSPIREQIETLLVSKSTFGLRGKSHLAWLAGVIGRDEEKQEIWQETIDTCPVYQRSPELVFEYSKGRQALN